MNRFVERNKMNLDSAEEESATAEEVVHPPMDITWEMLHKPKFFSFGGVLFSGLAAVLHPITMLKTRQQVTPSNASGIRTGIWILKHEGIRGLYRGFGTSLAGTIPSRILYMAALEKTKFDVRNAFSRIGFHEHAVTPVANAAAGLSAALAAQVIWTPVDVISQRLMTQVGGNGRGRAKRDLNASPCKYRDGVDAFRKILNTDGVRGLYRGFGISLLIYAPTNAAWWASYSMMQRLVWSGMEHFLHNKEDKRLETSNVTSPNDRNKSDTKALMLVQGMSAALAGGVSALVTMPLDTIKTRLQVLDGDDKGRKGPTIMQTARNLLREGGWMACYRGWGPRWASMSMSSTIMITTYEFLKRNSMKNQEVY